jgi:hypothetical protein
MNERLALRIASGVITLLEMKWTRDAILKEINDAIDKGLTDEQVAGFILNLRKKAFDELDAALDAEDNGQKYDLG